MMDGRTVKITTNEGEVKEYTDDPGYAWEDNISNALHVLDINEDDVQRIEIEVTR